MLDESSRHQRRDGHRLENAARRAAENEFAQARVAVAAHHHEVRGGVGRVRQQRARHIDVGRDDALDLNLQPVTRQMMADVGAGDFVALRPLVCGLPDGRSWLRGFVDPLELLIEALVRHLLVEAALLS